GFFEKWRDAKGRFVPPEPAPAGPARIAPESPARPAARLGEAYGVARADAAIECIDCGVCYAACDVVAWNPDYLGPAQLNRAWTLVNDVRDADRLGHLRAVAGDAGCHACHSHQSCAEHCPRGLNPTASIAGLKRALAAAALKGEL
ncbi:MAG: 4Fe-4S dicluster domain-containing protein, partial [Kiloniellales bacterium]